MNSSYKPFVPGGWLECPRKSMLIADTFVVCKTFLDGRYNLEIENLFDLSLVKSSLQNGHKRNVGMVIDLTNTDRFYNKNEIEQQGCRYVKIPCKGFNESPSQIDVNKFIWQVQNFKTEFPNLAICVHCTHGFNRSGFMIVSYLCSIMKLQLEMAINVFAQARSPGIYKAHYLSDLAKRYGNGIENIPVAPAVPEWALPKCQMKLKETKFMDGLIANVDNVNDEKLVKEIQSIVMDMCGWKIQRFPGSQPVSMDSENIFKLATKKYRVTWKADGQRYMMLIKGMNEIYMIDRDFALYRANNLIFPKRNSLDQHVTNTLLDGEMVIDKYPDCQRGRYLVYDIIRIDGHEADKANFDIRQQYIHFEIIEPRTIQFNKGLLDKCREPFSITQKQFWDVDFTHKILGGEFAKSLMHDSDGLIFQPVDDAYQFGQCKEVLKWKPPHLESIDYKLLIEKREGEGIVGRLLVAGLKHPFASIDLTKELTQLNGKIIECSWDYDKKAWKFLRERTDKSFANRIETARSIMGIIRNPITKEYLYHVIDNRDNLDSEKLNDDYKSVWPLSKPIMPIPDRKRRMEYRKQTFKNGDCTIPFSNCNRKDPLNLLGEESELPMNKKPRLEN